MIKGVVSAEPGYAAAEGSRFGQGRQPTYEEVATGKTSYVEVVRVTFTPDEISFGELLQVFFASHDPTELNRQGSDVGSQYASVIFCTSERQREMAERYTKPIAGGYTRPMTTKVLQLGAWHPAEDYHQKYFANHRDAPYCQLVIVPKVEKVENKFKKLLKE